MKRMRATRLTLDQVMTPSWFMIHDSWIMINDSWKTFTYGLRPTAYQKSWFMFLGRPSPMAYALPPTKTPNSQSWDLGYPIPKWKLNQRSTQRLINQRFSIELDTIVNWFNIDEFSFNIQTFKHSTQRPFNVARISPILLNDESMTKFWFNRTSHSPLNHHLGVGNRV